MRERFNQSATLFLLTLLGVGVGGCMDLTTPDPADEFPIDEVVFDPSLGIDLDDFEETPNGIWIREDVPGMPPNAGPGTFVEVEFRGWLPSGAQFTETGPDETFEFLLGGFDVLPGVQEGVDGMSVGQTRTVLIPPFLAYGRNPPQGIPENSWLIFELTLVSVDGEGGGPI